MVYRNLQKFTGITENDRNSHNLQKFTWTTEIHMDYRNSHGLQKFTGITENDRNSHGLQKFTEIHRNNRE